MSLIVGLASRLTCPPCNRNQSYETTDETTANPFPEDPVPDTDTIPETHTAMQAPED